MAYICCKGLYTRPCNNCGRYICPTSGCNEMFYHNNNEYCRNCMYEIAWKPQRKNKKYQKLFNKICTVVDDYETIMNIKNVIEQEMSVNINNFNESSSSSSEE